ncbi:MAG: electron transport complex subunit RsxA [Deltaproteobacteria bacterium]|nr:electron transport complex subunit RsxA [Deltaproteobacteria bacterium]
MMDYLVFIVSCVLVNNILLAQFLGNCPFLGTSKKMDTAVGMSAAVVFVLVLAGAVTWIVQKYVLVPLNLEYLRTIAFILVIAGLVQFVEMFLKKNIPALYAGLGIYLPLITTNCAVLGVCIINIDENYGFVKSLASSFAYPVGFGLALILFAGLRERILLARVPKPLQDVSLGLITAGMIALSFGAFKGMA